MKYISITEYAQRKWGDKWKSKRSSIYQKIVYGHLKEGKDWKEEVKKIKRIVVREDLKV